jgi:polysaccharide biosynthesis protein PslG
MTTYWASVPRLLIPIAIVLCLAPAHTAAPGPQARRAMFGLTGWSFPSRLEVRSLSRRGLRSWRVIFSWADVEGRRGRYQWFGFDGLVARLASRRVAPIFVLTGCPSWACNRHGLGPPRSARARSAWAAFVQAAVRRYGNGGAYWRARPRLRYLPVRYWQVLNEINGRDQWPSPSASGYASLLKRSAAAIRRADPYSSVVLGGLGEKMTIWLRDYLSGLYRQPGFARDFDVMAVEGYSRGPRDVARIMRTTRRIMRRSGDLGKPVWITEMSWATGGARHPFVTTRRLQARKLRRAYDLLLACRGRWNLQRVYWFSHRDRRRAPGERDYWGNHNGLFTSAGRWKPALRTFLHYIRRRLPRSHHTSCHGAARAAHARL